MLLERAIKQKEFSNDRLRAAVNLYYTSARMQSFETGVLKPYGISLQQFNLLRILRGQKGNPISISEIAIRMIDKMSNTSRLAEKLRSKELIARNTCSQDRRKVEIILTETGYDLISAASTDMDAAIVEKLSSLTSQEVTDLNHLLDKINCS